jgi:hypothetical protein
MKRPYLEKLNKMGVKGENQVKISDRLQLWKT